MSEATRRVELPHPRANAGALRTCRGRAGVPRCLSRRPHAACLADRRPARHRQGDARLPHGALRVRASGSDGTAARRRDTLALPPDHRRGPPRRRAGPRDLLALERTEGRQGQAAHGHPGRRWCASTIGFFGSTAGEGGWRVCIVDSADELNAAGANALLKILEEPPAKSPAAGGEPRARPPAADHPLALPPARAARRSRRRTWRARSPMRSQRDAGEAEIKAAALAADGSVARALDLLGGTALQVRERVNAMLAALPGGRSARPACARRRARARRDRVHGLRRCGARLAQRARYGRGRRARAGSLAWPRSGTSSTPRRAT